VPKRSRPLAVFVFCSVVLELAGPASAGIPPGRYAIGDSVMLGAKDELSGRGIRVNAVVSRQFRDAVPLVERLRADGQLRKKIVIPVGMNGILMQAA
jgi:hypothetical protein